MSNEIKEAIIGKEIFKSSGGVAGFHFHYTLPEGIVGKERIKSVRRSLAREIFLQQYNFLVAIDPAILTFCQSTPFWMGYHWAKDCRVLMYRDMRVDKGARKIKGLHYHHPMFGSLPSYEFTLEFISDHRGRGPFFRFRSLRTFLLPRTALIILRDLSIVLLIIRTFASVLFLGNRVVFGRFLASFLFFQSSHPPVFWEPISTLFPLLWL